VLHERNFRKGAALHAGFHDGTGNSVILQNVDLERYDPGECSFLRAPTVEHLADLVFGLLLTSWAYHLVYSWRMVEKRQEIRLKDGFRASHAIIKY
jgi:hypothetical protein